MRRKGLTPLLLILVVAFGGLGLALATDSSPELGLDLQGGVSVVLAPTESVEDERLDEALEIIRTRVDALGVAEPEIARQGEAIVVQLPGVRNRDRALDLVGQTAELRFRPVLQAAEVAALEQAAEDAGEGGDATTDDTATDDTATDDTAPDDTATDDTAPDDTATDDTATDDGATTTTASDEGAADEGAADEGAADEGAGPVTGLAPGENAGAAGPRAPVAAHQETPGTSAPDDTTATTAPADPTATTAPADPTATTVPGGEAPTAEGEAPVPGGEPAPGITEVTPREEDEADQPVVLDGKEDGMRYQLGPTLATGRIVESARAELVNGQWQVSLTIRGGEDGIDKFNEIASQCFSQAQTCPAGSLAIVLDSVVQSAPTIQQPSYTRDEISISGSFGESEAKDLALVLRYGSLPVELERQTVQTVSASLGEDSLRAGVIAGMVGLALVAIYMILYYRALGFVVILGFVVWGSLMYAVVCWLGETQGLALTLSGVTGMIMSIGVTVDSYVVFFERLKDEVRAGRTLRSSTERAFRRAFQTILAANITSFIGAAVLWWLTVGSVRGFALFLGLSTVLGVIVTWLYTRPVVTLLSRSTVFTEMPVLGVARGLAREDKAPTTSTPRATTAGAGR